MQFDDSSDSDSFSASSRPKPI